MLNSLCRGLALAIGLLVFAGPLYAVSPLAPPGDYQLRHDLQTLADAGVLSGPVQMWPVSWPQIHADVSEFEGSENLAGHELAALARVRSRVRRVRDGGGTLGMELKGGSEPQFLRSFADTPRGEAEGTLSADWLGERFAWSLRATYADDDPADETEERLDGSWVGGVFGNWMIAAGAIQRHWGPGWQGSLIMSNNARPRPGVTLRRVRTEAFETKWLSWIGPWHFTTFVERLEHARAVSHALMWGMRFAFRPFESLELGVSRSVQFGGEGRDVDFDTVVNVVTGQTTSTNLAAGSDAHYNQLGGFDARWKLPYVNAALYSELIGEDESGSRPDLYLGQGGIEVWGGLGEASSWRLIFERADTKADVLDSSEREGDAEFGIAYNNPAFPTGYRYRGRVIGYPTDGDATLSTVRFLLDFAEGSFVNLAYLDGNLNRTRGATAQRNTLTSENEDVEQLELSWNRQFRFGQLELGGGRTERKPIATGEKDSEWFGWVGFNRRF